MKSEMHSLNYVGRLLQLCELCLAILVPLTACAEDMKTIQWREEVKLSNGQIIIADQTEEYRTKEEALRVGALFNNYRIQAIFPAPISKTVIWEGHLKPLALDIAADGEIYLVMVTQTKQAAREYSPEDGRHVAFKFSGLNQWVRVPVETVPHDIKPNLLIEMGELFIKQGYPTSKVVDLSLKSKIDSDPRIDRSYRSWSTK